MLFTVAADWTDDELKLRAIAAQDLDKAAAEAGEGLRVYLEDARALGPISAQLRNGGKGIVTLVVPGQRRPRGGDQDSATPAGERGVPRRDQIVAGRRSGGVGVKMHKSVSSNASGGY